MYAANGKSKRRKPHPQLFTQDWDDHVFGAEMVGIDQIDAELLRREKPVVLHVRCYERVAAHLRRKVQHAAAGAAADRKLLHRASAVDIAQTIGVQPISDIGQKIRQRHGFRQPADAAAGQRAAIVGCTGWLEAARDLSAQRHHERVVDAAFGNVQIRVHTDGRNAVPRERKHLASGEIVRRRMAQRREDEWVV